MINHGRPNLSRLPFLRPHSIGYGISLSSLFGFLGVFVLLCVRLYGRLVEVLRSISSGWSAHGSSFSFSPQIFPLTSRWHSRPLIPMNLLILYIL